MTIKVCPLCDIAGCHHIRDEEWFEETVERGRGHYVNPYGYWRREQIGDGDHYCPECGTRAPCHRDLDKRDMLPENINNTFTGRLRYSRHENPRMRGSLWAKLFGPEYLQGGTSTVRADKLCRMSFQPVSAKHFRK